MKTKYAGHTIEVRKDGTAIMGGHVWLNLAAAIAEVNFVWGIGNQNVGMNTRVADL